MNTLGYLHNKIKIILFSSPYRPSTRHKLYHSLSLTTFGDFLHTGCHGNMCITLATYSLIYLSGTTKISFTLKSFTRNISYAQQLQYVVTTETGIKQIENVIIWY